jgi:phenylacetate-coenzyme A ligase PaaK-like adenylate-forming protein
VLVCFPSFPWSIGSIFAEASLRNGYNVFAPGLNATNPRILDMIQTFRPNVICSSPRFLIRLESLLKKNEQDLRNMHKRLAFVAGEYLSLELRQNLSLSWNFDIIDIYGMAEFDTVGFQSCLHSQNLVLIPIYEYAILFEDKIIPLNPGVTGRLLIKEYVDKAWHITDDVIKIVQKVKIDLYTEPVWCFKILGRIANSVTLTDGTQITETVVDHLRKENPMIKDFQISINHSLNGDDILINCSSVYNLNVEGKIIHDFLHSSADIEDSYSKSIIKRVSVKFLPFEKFTETPRGKIPLIMESDDYYD